MTLIADAAALSATYGPVTLLAVTVLAAFGLPAPASLGLLAAGALAAHERASWGWMTVAGLTGTIIGDHLAYLLAASASGWVHRLPVARHFARAEALLDRWGLYQVFVSRWLFPTVLTPATNYFAGLSRFPLTRFTPAVIVGEAVYVFGYMALGALFSNELDRVNRMAGRTSLLAFLAVAAVVGLVAWGRSRRSEVQP